MELFNKTALSSYSFPSANVITLFQVQGKDRVYVKYIAEKLGLEGSYVARTYIEQIQLEKLVNDVMLSILDNSYSTQRDKHLSKLTRLVLDDRSFRSPRSPAGPSNQGAITQLSEQISTLNERIDEFASRIEELNIKLCINKVSTSQQNLALHSEACNGSVPTALMVGLSNGALSRSLLNHSTSAPQLAKDTQMMEEVVVLVVQFGLNLVRSNTLRLYGYLLS